MNYPAASRGVSTASLLRHSGLDPESSELELVPDFRRDDVWTPAFAPGYRHSGAGLVTVDAASRGELTRRTLKEYMK